jgi:hypothetical protein
MISLLPWSIRSWLSSPKFNSGGFALTGAPLPAASIVNNNIPVITLAVSPASVTEDGGTNLVYTFTRSGPTTGRLIVNYAVRGTATLGTDYTGIAATPAIKSVSFAVGSSTAKVIITPIADTTPEANETVILTLAAGRGYTIGTTSAVTGTITNDDVALPTITLGVSPATVLEDGAPNLVYTFTRNGATTAPLTINYTVGGTALFSSDYTQSGAASFAATTGSIAFAAGSSTAILTIDPTADSTPELNETIALTLIPNNSYTIGTTSAVTGTITNDDINTSNFSLYMIGNSLTDQLRFNGFDTLVESQGVNLAWGRHTIPGSPLDWTYDHPDSGFQEPPYGYYPNAFRNYTWNAITLQPFIRLMPSDLDSIDKYLNLLNPQSNTDIYIYAQWPNTVGPKDWETRWNEAYTGNWDGTNMTKDYYEDLVVELKRTQPDFDIYMIPVGHVMEELDNRMEAGLVPGYDDITKIFIDEIHLNNIGSYIVATTFYATLFKRSPIGLPVPTEYQPLSTELAAIVQDAVWDIVPTIPLAGF